MVVPWLFPTPLFPPPVPVRIGQLPTAQTAQQRRGVGCLRRRAADPCHGSSFNGRNPGAVTKSIQLKVGNSRKCAELLVEIITAQRGVHPHFYTGILTLIIV